MSEPAVITPMADGRPRLFALELPALIAGGAGIVLSVVGFFVNHEQFFRSWLYAWMFCLGIALGALGMVMLQHLVIGEWGLLIRRIGEAAGMTLPVLLVLGLPLALGMGHLFPWARHDEVAADPVLAHRRPFFNGAWVLARALVYFAVWILLAWRLRAISLRMDDDPTDARMAALRRWSAAGMVLYFLTMSSAAVDWIMSREAHWYSTVFGFIVIAAQGLAALAFVLLVLAALWRDPPMDTAIRADALHDLGNMVLLMVILWAYTSFAQLLVIWLGNTQQDVPWYVHRSHGFWRFVTVLLVLFQFFAPFILLLNQPVKRSIRAMAWMAGGLLVTQWLNTLWLIAPSSPSAEPHPLSWMDFVTPVAVGGVWLASFLWILRRRPLLPLGLSVAVKPFDHGPNDVTTTTTRPVA
jgi:hypothetical protein